MYRINGIEDHVHILSDLHPTIALADYVKDIKKEKDILINYIKNQQKHHQQESMQDEQIRLLKKYGIKPDR